MIPPTTVSAETTQQGIPDQIGQRVNAGCRPFEEKSRDTL